MQSNFRLQSLLYPTLIRLAQIRIFASFCIGRCGTSIAHNIKAMMTYLGPCYHIQYKSELLYLSNALFYARDINKARASVNLKELTNISRH